MAARIPEWEVWWGRAIFGPLPPTVRLPEIKYVRIFRSRRVGIVVSFPTVPYLPSDFYGDQNGSGLRERLRWLPPPPAPQREEPSRLRRRHTAFARCVYTLGRLTEFFNVTSTRNHCVEHRLGRPRRALITTWAHCTRVRRNTVMVARAVWNAASRFPL